MKIDKIENIEFDICENGIIAIVNRWWCVKRYVFKNTKELIEWLQDVY